MKKLVAIVLILMLSVPSLAIAGPTNAVPMPVPAGAAFTVVRLDGADAKAAFLRAISPEALKLALERSKERELRPTDTFTVYEVKPKPGLKKAQTTLNVSGGRVLVWDWEDYDTNYTAGTMIVDTWDPSTSTTFDFRYWTNDYWGATSYTRLIELRDRDGRITKEVAGRVQPVDVPRLLKAVFGQTDECRQARAAWRQCMRECLKERLNASLWTAVGAGGGSVKSCATNATRAGAFGIYVAAGVFLGCELLAAGMAGGMAIVYQFGARESCDGYSNCGPAPTCQ